MYRSQAAQDKWVEDMTEGKTGGFFVEVGAYDGIHSSNTYYLEQVLGWRGICIEAGPEQHHYLAMNRPLAINVHKAVMPYTGTCNFNNLEISEIGEVVPCDTLSNILKDNNAPKILDYVSLDIEGGEVGALESFDWDSYRINLLTVEHNLYMRGPLQKESIHQILSEHGYVRVVEDVRCLDPAFYMVPFEDWYAHPEFLASKRK